MKYYLAQILIVMTAYSVSAQHLSISGRVNVSKSFEFSDKFRLGLRNRLQVTPELTIYTKDYNELFNEIDLLPPIDDQDENESEDEEQEKVEIGERESEINADEIDDVLGGGQPQGGNNDVLEVDMNLRNSSSMRLEYRLSKTISFRSEYNLFLSPNSLRQGLGGRIRYSPKFKNRKFRYSQSIYSLHTFRKRRDKVRWDHGLGSTGFFQYRFSKSYRWNTQGTLQTELEGTKIHLDRVRIDTGIEYAFNKTFRFELRYRFQYRFNRSRNAFSNGLLFAYNILL